MPGMARGGRARPLPCRRTRSAVRAPLRALRRAARPAAFLHARAPRAVPGTPDHVLAPRPLPGPPAPSALPPRPRPCLARLTSAWPSPHPARPCPALLPPTAWAAGLAAARAARRCCSRARSSSSAASAEDVDTEAIFDAMIREGWRWGRLGQLQCALSAFPDTADLDDGNDEFLALQARIPDNHPDPAKLRLWCMIGIQLNQGANAARALLATLTAQKKALAADIKRSLQQPPSKPPMQTRGHHGRRGRRSQATAAAAGAGARPAATIVASWQP